METQGILLALTSKSVYSIVLWWALSFEERVSIDGQSINYCWGKAAQDCGLWGHTWVELCSKIQSHVIAIQIRLFFSVSLKHICKMKAFFSPSYICYLSRVSNSAIVFQNLGGIFWLIAVIAPWVIADGENQKFGFSSNIILSECNGLIFDSRPGRPLTSAGVAGFPFAEGVSGFRK